MLLLLADVACSQQEGPLTPVSTGAGFYPRAAELKDGTLLATFDHAIDGGRAVACVRSRDRGRTWGEYVQIAVDSGRVDVANAFPLALNDGTILVAYRHHTLDRRVYRLEVAASTDGGRHWEKRGRIVEGSVGLWEPFLFQLSEKVIQAYYASEEGIYPDQRIEMRQSEDGGRTWGQAVVVARKRGSRDGMPSVARLKDETLLACFEASDLPPFRFVVRIVRSADGGATWSGERDLVYSPQNPAEKRWAAGAPYLICLEDGRMLVSFQADEDVQFRPGEVRADPDAPGYRYERHTSVKVVTSVDGKACSRPMRIAGAAQDPATWGGLCTVRAGNVLAFVTWRGRIWCRTIGAAELPH